MTVDNGRYEDFDETELIEPEDLPSIRKTHKAYQIMAYVVGVLLIVLTCFGVPLKYLADNDLVVRLTGVPHGWLYAILLITVVVLGMKVKWSWKWYLGIALAGTVPFLSFYAERKATKYVHEVIRKVESHGPTQG